MNLEIEWLKSKWNAPKGALAEARELFKAHEKGSTACKLEAGISELCKTVAASPDGDPATPLVLVEHGGNTYLQTRWFFEAEKQIAARLLDLHSKPTRQVPAENLKKYFPKPGDQREAAALALSQNLAVITGGPGTGKTYTLARILAILLETEDLDPRQIQLAAPTGKAADRMREAVEQSSGDLGEDLKAKLQAVSASSKTIHALLGHHPGKNACSFNADQRLPCRILIVDECSMVDTLLWRALLEALPEDCKPILLGDPNQLESVGRGSVFSSIARAPELQSARKILTESRRFADRPAIASFAKAIESQNVDGVLKLISENKDPDCPQGLFWSESSNVAAVFQSLPPIVLKVIEDAAFADSAETALGALGKVRILTAHRSSGRASVEEEIEKLFSGRRIGNRPVIIDRNDPETGLRNGEVGVVHISPDQPRIVVFEKRDKNKPSFSCPLSKLPDHSPAWAITIHRSQGSEYENVVVILPHKSESPLATRELLYTAITRAKTNLFVFGPQEVIRQATLTPSNRTTLLEWQIGRLAQFP